MQTIDATSDVVPVRGFDPRRFLGHWLITYSSFAFWRPRFGHVRSDPEVTYARLSRPYEPDRWSDEVSYRATPWLSPHGTPKPRTILGIDTPIPGAPGRFQWRGEGALALLRSEWTVLAVGPEYEWAVTHFPRGIDFYVRAPDASLNARAIVAAACTTPTLREAAEGLTLTMRT